MSEISLPQIVVELGRTNLLPAIVFRSSRNQCDEDVERVAGNPKLAIEKSLQRVIKDRIGEIATRYDLDMELITSHPHYASLINTAVGAHHAGQLLMWRLVLEELMAASLLRILVATGTVAAGVDFPARTVIITAHTRRGSEGYQKFSSSEFQQMSGRAGRRGKDAVGFCLAAPSRFCDARVLKDIAGRPPEPLKSSYFPSPSTVLNLLRYRTVDGLRFTVERSLAAFKDKKDGLLLRREAEEAEHDLKKLESSKGDNSVETERVKKLKKRIRRLYRMAEDLDIRQNELLRASLDGLRSLSYVSEDVISEKGAWAANLCTTLVIELAEFIEEGIINHKSSLDELVAIVASISGDAHRPYLKGKDHIISSEISDKMTSVLNRVQLSGMPGILEDREVLEDAARTALLWLRAENWLEFRTVLLLGGVAEGDAARLISQTSEQLNQIARLTQSHPELSSMAADARQRLLRPPLTEAFEF
ncbi:MAG TPA: helicase-related protein [Oligoflexia bacterium]|nr:helicase-related protein [Oligoflexia bacterium]HMP48413.1 helicase-related protein [Oligoflexia bacterium]